MTDIRHGFKIFTHDWRSPIQGGRPVVTGEVSFPFTLPPVALDTSLAECSAGWNFTATLAEAARIAGYWKTGYPAKCTAVTASEDAIERGQKRRGSQLVVERLVTREELLKSMQDIVMPWAGTHVEELAQSQLAWYEALGRPDPNTSLAIADLQRALEARGLQGWKLREFPSARDARAAWDAWDARAAWHARVAWASQATRDARAAWHAWDAWATRDSWATRDAQAALIMEAAVTCFGLTDYAADCLTTGIREAYRHGLEVAVPIGNKTLGYCLVPIVR